MTFQERLQRRNQQALAAALGLHAQTGAATIAVGVADDPEGLTISYAAEEISPAENECAIHALLTALARELADSAEGGCSSCAARSGRVAAAIAALEPGVGAAAGETKGSC